VDEQQPKRKRGGGFATTPGLASAAGKRGGRAVQEKLGSDHFQAMGFAGGAATKEKLGAEHYRKIGRAGAKKRWAKERERREAELDA
jgi:hypothetical protein